MSTANQINELKQCQRFMDINDEPLTMLAPIRGYEKMPLVTLEKAVEPLIPQVPDIKQMVFIAKKKTRNPPPDNLSIDESAAIMLYTLEWEPRDQSVYYLLNKALRIEDRQVLRPWFLYLKLFFSALEKLPSGSCIVFRGVKTDLRDRYKKGEKIVWWAFSSCTSTMDVLNNDSFLGPAGQRTLFTIECQTGKDIEKHSYFKKEKEVLLPAAREFVIESVFAQDDGLVLVHLKEIEAEFPLLEPNSTLNHIVQKVSKSQHKAVTPQSNIFQPVNKQPIQTSPNQIFSIPNGQSTVYVSNSGANNSNYPRMKYGAGRSIKICCGLIFCCPCTICYLLMKNK